MLSKTRVQYIKTAANGSCAVAGGLLSACMCVIYVVIIFLEPFICCFLSLLLCATFAAPKGLCLISLYLCT